MNILKKSIWFISYLDNIYPEVIKQVLKDNLEPKDEEFSFPEDIYFDEGILFDTEEAAVEFGTKVLLLFAKYSDKPIPSLIRDGFRGEVRFVGNPKVFEENLVLTLERDTEYRSGRIVKSNKNIIFEGQEYSRNIEEVVWDDWKSGREKEILIIYCREKLLVK